MFRAVLLLGPTGAGKTPVGGLLEQRGLWGQQAHHFDFGANLRAIAAEDITPLPHSVVKSRRGAPAQPSAKRDAVHPKVLSIFDPEFSPDEIAFLREVLSKGVLLEAESFYLALKVLRTFIETRHVSEEDWLIINGLPRHIGQAEGLREFLRVEVVIELALRAEAVLERLRKNVGGDRAERTDDSDELVLRKLVIYNERTQPLLDWYRQRGAKVLRIAVGANTTPEEAWEQIRNSRPG